MARYAIDRFSMEVKRQFDVLDKHLAGKQFICDDEYALFFYADNLIVVIFARSLRDKKLGSCAYITGPARYRKVKET